VQEPQGHANAEVVSVALPRLRYRSREWEIEYEDTRRGHLRKCDIVDALEIVN
jgi:hypothetical protein